ncbi:G-type lectin S-receptor-like serine/threonine-protein kinase B120 [Magnolia sinica]|uniref:G-type lectin S-receptor-like serine/threonine-protein kinase B120 n=1 Tax=Magnolia sinica TaxID=86752 RepID=UPI002658D29F|nr:G-type lectin S-receptor-like serine/threonine-protein kinase B120 [Magnolia sinica]
MLPEGNEIAVERLSKSSEKGLEEFKNMVASNAKFPHSNLVRVLGCCIEGEEKLLVYEYMPNESLDAILPDQTKQSVLNWTKRLRIVEEIAEGLRHLHECPRLKINYQDLKPARILLDSKNLKISDFGMARIFGGNQIQENTSRAVGT